MAKRETAYIAVDKALKEQFFEQCRKKGRVPQHLVEGLIKRTLNEKKGPFRVGANLD